MEYPKINKNLKIMEVVPFKHLNVDDPIFSSLKDEYQGSSVSTEFKNWFKKMSDNDVKAYVSFNENKEVICITNVKDVADDDEGLKIRIIKTLEPISFAEFAIKIGVWKCIENGYDKVFFTHFTEDSDKLTNIASAYGFKKIKTVDNEDYYQKEITFDSSKDMKFNFPFISKEKQSFLVPIQEEYAKVLMPNSLKTDNMFGFIPYAKEGNSIEKIYICASNIRSIAKGDILFFYKSQNNQGISACGIFIDFKEIKTIDDFKEIENRSVFDETHINQLLIKNKNPLIYIKFLHCFNTEKIELTSVGIEAPQSIISISNENKNKIISLMDKKWKHLFR